MRLRKYLILLLLAIGTSCSTGKVIRNQANRNAATLLTLKIGMPIEEVMERMGEGTEYVVNPYRSQSRSMEDGRVITILHFYTAYSTRPRGGLINDECLTPVVFRDQALIGWGSQFFEEYVQKFEIRLR